MVYAKRQVLEVVLGVEKSVGLKLLMVGIVPINHIYYISVERSYGGSSTGSVLHQTPTRCRKSPAEAHGEGWGAREASSRPPAASAIASSTTYVGAVARARSTAASGAVRAARRALHDVQHAGRDKG